MTRTKIALCCANTALTQFEQLGYDPRQADVSHGREQIDTGSHPFEIVRSRVRNVEAIVGNHI